MYGIGHSRGIFEQPKRSTASRRAIPPGGIPTLNALGLTSSPSASGCAKEQDPMRNSPDLRANLMLRADYSRSRAIPTIWRRLLASCPVPASRAEHPPCGYKVGGTHVTPCGWPRFAGGLPE